MPSIKLEGGSAIKDNITDINALSDAEIIKAVLNGHKNAFSRLVERYERLVLTICRQRISDSFEAENAAQETFISAYRSLSLYAGGAFKGWLARIAVNKCNDYYRSKKHIETVDIEQMELESQSPKPLDLAIDAIQREKLLSAVANLPEKYRNAVQGYYLQSRTVKEMAEAENMSPKTIETRLYRGLKLLKDRKEELI